MKTKTGKVWINWVEIALLALPVLVMFAVAAVVDGEMGIYSDEGIKIVFACSAVTMACWAGEVCCEFALAWPSLRGQGRRILSVVLLVLLLALAVGGAAAIYRHLTIANQALEISDLAYGAWEAQAENAGELLQEAKGLREGRDRAERIALILWLSFLLVRLVQREVFDDRTERETEAAVSDTSDGSCS